MPVEPPIKCKRCPSPTRPGRQLCQTCANKSNQVCKERYLRLIAAGLCNVCGVVPAVGPTLCPACHAKRLASKCKSQEKHAAARARREHERRIAAKAAGRCYICLKRKCVAGRRKCASCHAKRKAYMRSPAGKDAIMRGSTKQREAKLAAGLCRICGKATPEAGKLHCRPCLDKAKARARRNPWTDEKRRTYAQAWYAARKEKAAAAGLCVGCVKQPAAAGLLFCRSCLDRAKAYAAGRKRNQTTTTE